MCERTQEFLNLIDRQLKSENSSPEKATKRKSEPTKAKSEFQDLSLEITKGTHRINGMLMKLSKLVKRQGLFDDPTSEINNLVVLIKQGLDSLNTTCESAQQYVDTRKRQLGDKNQSINHYSKVVSQLKADLMSSTKDFKSVLETRSIKMKDQQQKKVQLTGVGTLSPLRQFAASAAQQAQAQAQTTQTQNRNTAPDTDVALRRSGSAGFPQSPYTQLPTDDLNSSQKSTGMGSFPVQPQYQNQLLLAPPATQTYFESREQAVTEVEKTIGELGQLFKRLGTLISEQQELVERIDEDVENAVSNADRAQAALLKTYEKVSSNKGLYMKLMAIITLFIIFFVLFLL